MPVRRCLVRKLPSQTPLKQLFQWNGFSNVTNTYRHTKIVVTLGPTTEAKATLQSLVEAGVDVMRLNMAHASLEWVAEVIRHIREVSDLVDRDVAVMMDVKGPEIRTGKLDQPIPLNVGDRIELHTAAATTKSETVPSVAVNYLGLPRTWLSARDVGGQRVIRLRVLEKDSTHILAEVFNAWCVGIAASHQLARVHVKLPALTEKDENDLRAGVAAGIDFVALSFVREAEDVLTLRRFLDGLGSTAKIIAKIEDQAGVRNSKAIIAVADAIMVARGDLGIEIEYYKLPLVQRDLVRECQLQGKPVIIATQLLESMITSPMPTRAEISDVSNAVREQADAVMLSGENGKGCLSARIDPVLKNIIESIEPTVEAGLNANLQLLEPKSKMLRSAATLSQELETRASLCLRVAVFWPMLWVHWARGVPIYAFTDVESIFRQLVLPWGVEPFMMPFSDDPEVTIANALATLKQKGWCVPGTWLVVITNALASSKVIDTLQLRQID